MKHIAHLLIEGETFVCSLRRLIVIHGALQLPCVRDISVTPLSYLSNRCASVAAAASAVPPLIQVVFGMDVASSEFLRDGKYDLDFKNPSSDGSQKLTGKELGDFYQELARDFPILSIEDPFDQVSSAFFSDYRGVAQ
jgi:enolase